jgi:hypothetical protein
MGRAHTKVEIGTKTKIRKRNALPWAGLIPTGRNRYKKRLGKVPLPYLFQVESGEPEKNVVGKKEGTV